ncbi:DUF4340 domain-containing protein [Paraneptunicella aestuarii]|uniref:DUF4340 domain-containing protein n=1 Tax=Paraneptunicella aestuarii TaxID=2831148 RepID=UPI001E5EF8DF|nr:DUF4340 domain-containing protein [Paraneptunicella aestuarii]UAA37804.1 DUF4340 domain-containing protein [Paraneptunicella aestuarii]
MNKHVLPLLGLVTIAVILGVLFTPSGKVTETSKGKMFPDIQEQAAQVSHFLIKNADGILLDAKREITSNGTQWIASNYHGYPVSQEKLSALLEQLVSAQKVEPKTSKADKYARLGVEPLEAEDAQSVLLQVQSGSGADTNIVDLLVGNASTGGSYVRVNGNTQSWLIDQIITLPDSQMDWLLQPILDVAPEQVKSLTLEDGGANKGHGWTVSKNMSEDDNYQLENMPEGRELRYSSILNSTVSSLVELQFDDLSAIDESIWQDVNTIKSLKLSTFDEREIRVRMRNVEDKTWIRFDMDGNASGVAPDTAPSPYWTQWQYQITSFAANQFDKTVEDFLSEPVEENEAAVSDVEANSESAENTN